MQLRIQVKAGRKDEGLQKVNDQWVIRVNAPAREGAANARVESLLADLLALPGSSVKIIKGHSAPYKTIAIQCSEEYFRQFEKKLV
jgi:uncharacterized protein YggU (UPF0235/DUF167 family)